MIVGVGGPSCSGKTTVVHVLKKILPDIGVVPEFAEEVARSLGYDRVEEVRKRPNVYLEFELEVLKRKIVAENVLATRNKFVLSDTTPAEVLLYSTKYLPKRYSKIVEKLVRGYLKRYDVVLLLEPIESPNVENSKFRDWKDVANRFEDYEALKRIYYEECRKVSEVPSLPLDARVSKILRILNSLKAFE